jgi:molybdopterin-guanine dinucleotide biosynthesis protein A
VLALVVVLAGGDSRRLGRDKLAVELAGRPVLDHLLDGVRAVAADVPVVAVGPSRPTGVPVTWVREQPAGGGPVAGLARALDVRPSDDALVAVLAGDQPFAGEGLAALLAACGPDGASDPDVEGWLGVDADGREQPLLAVYRCGALRRAIGAWPSGRSVRSVVRDLRVAGVGVPALATLDVDTEDDVRRAQEAVARSAP